MDKAYSEFVSCLAKPGEAILNEMTPEQADLLHMAVGVSGEAGELLDAVKKAVIYQRPIDRENVVEELGDQAFYMQGIMNSLGITWEEVFAHNRAKLSTRYASQKYSNDAAIARADKAGDA